MLWTWLGGKGPLTVRRAGSMGVLGGLLLRQLTHLAGNWCWLLAGSSARGGDGGLRSFPCRLFPGCLHFFTDDSWFPRTNIPRKQGKSTWPFRTLPHKLHDVYLPYCIGRASPQSLPRMKKREHNFCQCVLRF